MKYMIVVMGNGGSQLRQLSARLDEPINYQTVFLFYDYLQEHVGALPTYYSTLETKMINQFIYLISIEFYESKEEIEQIAKLIAKLQKIREIKECANAADLDDWLNYIR